MNNPGNPLQGLLGDLMKMIGSAQHGETPWLDAARALAHGVATDGDPEGNVDPIERMALEALARAAELHVTDITGLPVGSGGSRGRIAPTGRGAWALHMLDAWAPLLEKIAAANGQDQPLRGDGTATRAPFSGGADTSGEVGEFPGELGDPEDTESLGNLFNTFATTMGPVLTGMQFGSAIGHLARRALGQYALPVPVTGHDDLFVIPENIRQFADDWSIPIDQAQLWVCSHELTSHAVLSVPHVADAIGNLLEGVAGESAVAQQGLLERLTGEAGDVGSLQNLLSDPESLVADLVSPGQRRTSAELVAVTTAIGGYVDDVTARVAGSLTGSPAILTEAWYRYRTTGSTDVKAAGAVLSLDLSREQVDRGAAFVRGVRERSGDEGLARLWSKSENLPTPAELDAPGLWLERINLPPDCENHKGSSADS
ncbi:MAG: zinc-dependent metalloprotease [Acidimicrobiales bacterium]